MEPFYVTVLSNFTFELPNQGPRIDEFKGSIEVKAGLHSTMLLGYPVDMELDSFELVSWNTTTLESYKYVKIEEPSDSNFEDGLYGVFEPPLEAAGTTFILKMIFADNNEEDPQ